MVKNNGTTARVLVEEDSNNQKESSISMEMQIYLVSFLGTTITINAKLSDTITDLNQKIQENESISQDQQGLFFNGHQLEDGYTLSDYNIQKESTII